MRSTASNYSASMPTTQTPSVGHPGLGFGSGGGSCPKCAHVAIGRKPGRTEVLLRSLLRLKPAPVLCASFTRETAMEAVSYCMCSHGAHETVVAPSDREHVWLEATDEL